MGKFKELSYEIKKLPCTSQKIKTHKSLLLSDQPEKHFNFLTPTFTFFRGGGHLFLNYKTLIYEHCDVISEKKQEPVRSFRMLLVQEFLQGLLIL